MIVGGDAKLCGVFSGRKTRPQDGVVHHVEERTNAVPALVVKPDLQIGKILIILLPHEIRSNLEVN